MNSPYVLNQAAKRLLSATGDEAIQTSTVKLQELPIYQVICLTQDKTLTNEYTQMWSGTRDASTQQP